MLAICLAIALAMLLLLLGFIILGTQEKLEEKRQLIDELELEIDLLNEDRDALRESNDLLLFRWRQTLRNIARIKHHHADPQPPKK